MYKQNKKEPPPQHIAGTKAMLPRYHPNSAQNRSFSRFNGRGPPVIGRSSRANQALQTQGAFSRRLPFSVRLFGRYFPVHSHDSVPHLRQNGKRKIDKARGKQYNRIIVSLCA
jgi:hypothetical protein